MKNLHLLFIYVCTILVCTSCNKNDEIINGQPGEKYSRSQEVRNIVGDIENLSFYVSPQLENIPLTKEDAERIEKLASKAVESTSVNISRDAQAPSTRQVTYKNSIGYHEELIHIDNLEMLVALEWDAVFDSGYNSSPESINFADIHIDLKNAPSGYWYKIALKRWYYDAPYLIFKGEGELCKYIDNEEHLELIGFTFYIQPRSNGYGQDFRYTLDRL